MTEPKPSNDSGRSTLSSYAKYSALGFQMIAIICVTAYIGYRIDIAYVHHVKWVTAVMSLAGVAISFYLVFRSLKSS